VISQTVAAKENAVSIADHDESTQTPIATKLALANFCAVTGAMLFHFCEQGVITLPEALLENTAFDRFLSVAGEKPFSQRLLLVFAEKEQREQLDGEEHSEDDFSINPFMYVDKALDEVTSFADLLNDSLQNGRAWDFLYVTVADASKVTPNQISQRLEMMIKFIHQGEAERFLIFNALGEVAKMNKLAD
jgi:hypothetical protein